jgi:hypothetical protein
MANVQIMGIKGEELCAKGIGNIFKKSNSRKIPKSEEREAHPGTEASRTQNRNNQNRISPQHSIDKT